MIQSISGPEPATPQTFDWRRWLNSDRTAAVFVVITFVAMVAGEVAEQRGGARDARNALFILAYITGGYFGLVASIQALIRREVEVDLLMVLAALGAAIVDSPFEGAMLLFLFSLSNVLQTYAIGRTRDAIRSLMKLRPSVATLKRNHAEVQVGIEEVAVGDVFILRPGERVPLDGVVIEGDTILDQSSVTGESMPVHREVGSMLFAGTINLTGSVDVRVSKLAKDSTIARMIQLVEDAQGQKANTQQFLDKAERYYAAGVIVFTLALIVVPLLFGEAFDTAFYRAMTAMVVASPCALVISTPATILSAIGNGARHGVLFKGGASLEQTAHIAVVAFDKTGTLTVGKPTVTDVTVIPIEDTYLTTSEALNASAPQYENVLLTLAAAVESRSEHPLGKAILAAALARKIVLPELDDFMSVPGCGVRGKVHFMAGMEVWVGNPRLFDGQTVERLNAALSEVGRLQDLGKTSVIVARRRPDKSFVALGVIAIADTLRPGAREVVAALKKIGVKRVVMLTGDSARVARAIGAQAGVDEVYADLLPEDKVRIVKENLKHGKVAMVGDGVNDAPALATSSIGFAMGAAGSDVALESADVVLMANDLTKIPYAISMARHARRVVFQNLAFSMSVILVLLVSALVFQLQLPLGVVGHEGSTVLVCLNGLRLLAYRNSFSAVVATPLAAIA